MDKVKRKMIGQITSNKMTNTVVVKVEIIKVHPKYHKRYKIYKKFPAHVDGEATQYAIGDRVEIEEAKPYSKTVNWKVVSKI